MIKVLSKTGIEGAYLNIIKAIYWKLTLNGEKYSYSKKKQEKNIYSLHV